ncbi:VOC family protein [Arenibacter sp. TNZ]|jgi:lactoylglutathione lyase|nr:VOC family protein [Arenibacter sp. TNZ]
MAEVLKGKSPKINLLSFNTNPKSITMSPRKTFLQGNFNGLQHLGLPVSNLKASLKFYESLGFKRVLDSHVDVPEENDTILVAMMEQKGVIIELYQVTKNDLLELKSRKDGHVDHIAFDVADVEKAFNELKAAGFTIIEEQPIFLNFWEKGCKYFAVRGPDGEKLEFNQIL